MWAPLAGGRLVVLGLAALALVGGGWLLFANIGQRQGAVVEVAAETRLTPTVSGSIADMPAETKLETATFALG